MYLFCLLSNDYARGIPESAEVSSCGLRNISRTAYNVYSGAGVTDVPP